MKKTITMIAVALGIIHAKAQTPTIADFENLTLAADTFYENHGAAASWQTSNATFRYYWDNSFGGFWDAGFSYTNKNNVVNGTYHNMYAAITGKGYNNSNQYATAWEGYIVQKMNIKLSAPQQTVSGFYATNSTYAYKTMLNGGGPSRKFGDTLHTHSGLIPGNYPDWFRLSVYGYKNGVKKTDTVSFYLADFRFANNTQDYIVNTWQWVDCTLLGSVDSICMKLFSSDVGQFGINTPTYFCMDNFTTLQPDYVGLDKNASALKLNIYPNPFNASLIISLNNNADTKAIISDLTGKILFSEQLTQQKTNLDLDFLQPGIYFLEVNSGDLKTVKKIIKD